MSVFSFLAFAVAGISAKLRPNSDVELTKLQARIDELDRHLYESDLNARAWERVAREWQTRYELLVQLPEEELAHIRRAREAQQQHLAHMMMQSQQMNQMLAQQAYANPFNQGLGALGAQGVNQGYEWCNCVPARHDLFRLGEVP